MSEGGEGGRRLAWTFRSSSSTFVSPLRTSTSSVKARILSLSFLASVGFMLMSSLAYDGKQPESKAVLHVQLPRGKGVDREMRRTSCRSDCVFLNSAMELLMIEASTLTNPSEEAASQDSSASISLSMLDNGSKASI